MAARMAASMASFEGVDCVVAGDSLVGSERSRIGECDWLSLGMLFFDVAVAVDVEDVSDEEEAGPGGGDLEDCTCSARERGWTTGIRTWT